MPIASRRRLADALSRPRVQIAVLIAGTALAHAVLLLLAQRSPYLASRVGDESYYHGWARDVADGTLVRPTAFFTSPLFAYHLAAIYRVFGSAIGIVQASNVVLGVGVVALTWAAGVRLVGHGAALVGATLVAFTRVLFFHEWNPGKTLLVLFLTALALHAVARALERSGAGRWNWAGVAAGAGALAHPLLLVVLPAALLALAVRGRREGSGGLARSGLALVAGAGVAIAPATVHNLVQGGDLVLICSNGGHNLYLGNHAGNATGRYTSPSFAEPEVESDLRSEERVFRVEAERRTRRAMRPGEVSRFWTGRALSEMWETPRATALRYLRRLGEALGNEDVPDTRTYEFYLAEVRALRAVPWDFGLVAVLGLVGALLSIRDRDRTFLVAFVALFAASLATFFVYGRYRLPLLIPLALLGGVACCTVRRLLVTRRYGAVATAAAAAALAALVVFGEAAPERERSFFPDYYNQGNGYHVGGRVDLAMAEYEKAVTIRPGSHPAVAAVAAEVASFHLRRGDPAKAREILARAARARPGDPGLARLLASLPSQ